MKFKTLVQLLGLRQKPRHYPYKMTSFQLDDGNTVRYAQWLHPKEKSKVITPEMIEAYRQVIDEGDFCLDIGAHSGDSTIPLALAAGKRGCVLALEPNPYVYHVLEKNVRANAHLTNIRTIMAAAASEESFQDFEYSDSGFCNGGRHENMSVLTHGHPYKLEVFCINLGKELEEDFSEFLPRLKFIKVDTEGYDLYVLRSLKDVIHRFRPVIKAEIFKKTDTGYRRDLLSFLHEAGYAVHRIVDEPLEAGELVTSENADLWKHYDVICRPTRERGNGSD